MFQTRNRKMFKINRAYNNEDLVNDMNNAYHKLDY